MNFQRTRCQRLAASPTLLLIVLAIATVLSGAFAETADAQTVHALLVIMDDDLEIGISVRQNLKRVRNFLDRLPGTKLEIYSAEEMRKTNELKRQHILDWVKRCPAGAQDTIFVYYSGHGFSYSNKQHFLDLRPGIHGFLLMRSELAAELQAKQCRLKMLVTDACSNFVDTQLTANVKQYAALQSKAQFYAKNLFLQHEGFLDINAASAGHFALGGDDIGGFFTTALIERSFTAESDTNGDRFLSWKEVFAKCQTETQDLFQQALPKIRSNPTIFQQMEGNSQKTQVPHAYAPLPTPIRKSAGSGQTAFVEEIETTATLNVTSTPSGATVYFDRKPIGTTPLTHEVDLGFQTEKSVEVGLSLPGYEQKLARLTLTRGQRAAWRNVTLEKKAAQLAKRITGNDGAPMALIPAGEFQMGNNVLANTYGLDPVEFLVHTVYVDAFYMDVHEVTNAQFKAFVDAKPQWQKDNIPDKYDDYNDGDYLQHWTGNSYPSGKGNHPVVNVSWYAAMAYAQWAGKRLPTEAEWEKAASGGLQGQMYPWGNTLPDASLANYTLFPGDRSPIRTTAVGSYGANGYGLFDMAGNVWEWCLDAYKKSFYARSPRRNPFAGEMTLREVIANYQNVKSPRVLRGGSWCDGLLGLEVAARTKGLPTATVAAVGFRCARAVTP